MYFCDKDNHKVMYLLYHADVVAFLAHLLHRTHGPIAGVDETSREPQKRMNWEVAS
jgi:hypothetical protein